jgi:SNF2 family DNA or RNA helicase
MLLKKLFSKFKKEIKDSITFGYDEKYININIDFNSLNIDVKNFIEMSMFDLEHIIHKEDNLFKIEHKDIYELGKEYLELFRFPKTFEGSMEVKLRGLINQGNAQFQVKLFDEKEIFPYQIFGSILKVSNYEEYVLPKNMYDIFSRNKSLDNSSEYSMYSFIETLQEDTSNKIKFEGLGDNDFIKTVKKIAIDIQEDENNNLLLTPKFDDLPTEHSKIYEKNIDNSSESLLITNVDKKTNSLNRYLLNKSDIEVSKTINKTKKIKKEDVPKFMSNPTSFFEYDNEELEEKLKEVFDFGYRIVGIGEPYVGYFGSVKIDTPLSEVLKKDPEFIEIVDKEYVKEFVEDNEDDLPAIVEQIKNAKDTSKPDININGKKINDYEYDTYIDLCEKQIKKNTQTKEKELREEKSKEVLQINSNDESDIEIEVEYKKRLEDIIVEDTEPKNLYSDFEFTPKQHQVIALNWFIDLYKNEFKGCLLADDMGLGKTFQVISFINYIINHKKDFKILIVAPTILIDNWNNEFENALKQTAKQNYKIKIIRGSTKALDELELITKGKKTKEEVFKNIENVNFVDDYNIYITTYKTLQKYQFAWAFMAEDKNIGIECIVYDEAQNIKNPNALQTQAAKAVSSLCNFNILLSGTPIENELRDIWCLFDVFDPLFFGSWKNFRKEFVNNTENIESRLRSKISNYMLRRLKNQVLDSLPIKYEPKLDEKLSNHYSPKIINFTNEETKLYESIINSNEASLSKLRQLRLISMHPILINKEVSLIDYCLKNDVLNEFSKTRELLNVLENVKSKNEKAIIFVISKNMQILLKSTLSKKYGLHVHVVNGENNKSSSLKNMLDDFRSKEGFNIIILSTLAAGVGLTLNEANHVIHYERHWNPSKEDQASDRVYRIGQTKDVYIHHFIIRLDNKKSSFDEGLNQLIMNKKSLSEDTLIPTSGVTEKELTEVLFEKDTTNKLVDIDTLTPFEFENYVKEIFKKKGFNSTLTEKYPSEYGADVIAIKDEEIIAIQCKHSSVQNNFGREAMYQLHSEAKQFYKATKLIAITNSFFNSNAMNLAKVHGIEVIDKNSFSNLMSDFYGL